MPFAQGKTVTGWGVVKLDPWKFVGIFPTEKEAQEKAASLGPDYVVRFGENQADTDNFLWDNIDNRDDK